MSVQFLLWVANPQSRNFAGHFQLVETQKTLLLKNAGAVETCVPQVEEWENEKMFTANT